MAGSGAPLLSSLALLVILWYLTGSADARLFYSFYNYGNAKGIFNDVVFDVSTGPNCSSTLHAYEVNPSKNTAYAQMDCILSHIPEYFSANMAAGQILLGLAPTIFSFIGPSIAEISLLSTYRPFLAFLISFGSPTVVFDRFARYSDPLENIKATSGALPIHQHRYIWHQALISILQYLVAIGSTANIIQNAVQVGQKSVLSWEPENSYFLPVVWAVGPALIHLISSLTFRYSRHGKCLREQDMVLGEARQLPKAKNSWRTILAKEVQPCVDRTHVNIDDAINTQQSSHAIYGQATAELLAFIHILFGSLTLASMLFIAVISSMEIVGRFIISALACRLIVMYEISGLHGSVKSAMEPPEQQKFERDYKKPEAAKFES